MFQRSGYELDLATQADSAYIHIGKPSITPTMHRTDVTIDHWNISGGGRRRDGCILSAD